MPKRSCQITIWWQPRKPASSFPICDFETSLQENSPVQGLFSLIPYDMLLSATMWKIEFPFQRPQGMRGLFIIWLGQMISGIASSITAVALPIWIFSITDSGTAVGLLEFF